ncbi:MAG: mechanosensitive ion channel family protein [Gammaproteobacteria bacterium]|nr:mechanosensitive ion channel family protein [Gammaproteobacteria bacterium]
MIFPAMGDLETPERIALVLFIAVAAHVAVRGIRVIGHQLMSADALLRWNKLRTLAGLFFSALIFTLYFGALGLVLQEFGVSLTAYLASASVLGLAIGFGSQGVVQDVVTGLTVILSDLFQVGDMVEISGQIGIVQSISMRFTILLNPLGAKVYIPNRTLSSVIIYPRGYMRCFADITLSQQQDLARQMTAKIDAITRGFVEEYPGILRNVPEISEAQTTPSGRLYIRVKFRIWPGRGAPIENAYKSELVDALKKLDPIYDAWMVSINNEVSEVPVAIEPFRTRAGRASKSGKR